ncbi:hypothetical protein [Microbacterium halotolerans]|uniref:hypothetical protein n=1 Tax=Microbacterium halotolerans TaxID=246613 RepID=UPI0013C3548C|nr:hypothetical protein [Microbacterium halotolerans]
MLAEFGQVAERIRVLDRLDPQKELLREVRPSLLHLAIQRHNVYALARASCPIDDIDASAQTAATAVTRQGPL